MALSVQQEFELQTNSLQTFAKQYLNLALHDQNNPRAMRDLRKQSDHDFFAIQRTDLARELIQFPIPPHRVNFYEILVIEEGKNERSVDLEQFTLNNFSFSLTLPGQIVSDHLLSDTVRGFHLYFDQVFLRKSGLPHFAKQLLNRQSAIYAQMSELQFSPILQLLNRIEALYIADKQQQLLSSYFQTLLLELAGILPKVDVAIDQSTHFAIAQSFRKKLNLNPNASKTIQSYADDLGISVKLLHIAVQEVFGKSPYALKTESIMVNAFFYLSQSEQGVAQIAYQLGFEDAGYFGRFFKKHAQCSPGEWRAKNRA